MIKISNTYPDLPLTNYPEQIDTPNKYRDPSINEIPIIQEYYGYIDSGNYVAANQLLANNPSLKQCFISADRLNAFIEMNVALQRFFRDNVFQYIITAVKPKGVWSSSAQYSIFDLVIYSTTDAETGQTYDAAMVIKDYPPVGTTPADSEYFMPVTLRGEQGISGTGLSFREPWDSSKSYYIDDVVSYNNSLFVAKEDNTNKNPLTSSEWNEIFKLKQDISSVIISSQNISLDKKMIEMAFDNLSTSNNIKKTTVFNESGSISDEIRDLNSSLLLADKNTEFIKIDGKVKNIISVINIYDSGGSTVVNTSTTTTTFEDDGSITKEVE